ncbi:bacteriocin-like protein [Mucilaginibacter lutimaris]
MKKFEKLSRTEMKNVLGGVVKPPACTNACVIGNHECGDGKKCTSENCPDDPSFTHTVCVSNNS